MVKTHSLLLFGLQSLSFTHALWPAPSKSSLGNSTLWVQRNVDVQFSIASNNVGLMYIQNQADQSVLNSSDRPPLTEEIINGAIERTWHTILDQGFVPWKFHSRNADFEPKKSDGKSISSIKLELSAPDPPNLVRAAEGEVDESYTLKVTEAGDVTIAGKTSIGLVRGLTTFSQLFFAHSTEKDCAYTPYAPVDIEDKPVFVHRGFNMDLSRNYFPVKDIQRQIDALAFSKMNRLHLHITDAQSWPLEIPAMPELSAKGAYNAKLVYTPDDIAYLQRYGAMQGVQVLFEIDMPGHTSSVWYSHPELVASFNQQPDWGSYAAEPPSGTLKLNDSRVTDFIETLMKDLLPRIKPYTNYFHTGGDEVKANAYSLDPTLKTNDSKVIRPYLQKFFDHAHQLVRDAGLTPMVWEEMVLDADGNGDWGLNLGKDVIVQSWQDSANVQAIVSKGYQVLVGNYHYWYLDCGRGAWVNSAPEADQRDPNQYQDYCAPLHNWREVYSYDPLQNISKSDQHLVLGGEVHAWAEQIDPVNIDRVVWPRAAAAAEVLWSGANDPATNMQRNQIEAAPRLSDLRERLVKKGVMAEPIQMPFCTMEKNQCNA